MTKPMEYDSAQPKVLDHDVEIEVLSFEFYIHMQFSLYFLYDFSNLCNVIFVADLTFFSVFVNLSTRAIDLCNVICKTCLPVL